MSRTLTVIAALLVPLAALAANPDAAKIFTDKGSTYVRSDNKKALTVGAELVASTDEKGEKAVGKAVIMEVNGALARVSLDEEATKGGAKYVVFPKAKGGGAAAAKPEAEPAKAAEPAAAALPQLKGKIESALLRVNVNNDSDADWSECVLKYSDGTSYKMGSVAKHSEDAVLKVKFGFPAGPLYDHLSVECAEGEAKFYFAKPNAPVGKLKGHAVNEGGNSVTVYNDSDTSWSSCDVKKPDGSHFVLGNLKGRDHDGISGGRFRREAEEKKDLWLTLECKEGQLKVKAN